MSGVESSRESGMRLLRAGPEWGRPGNAVWGEGREQASEAVQGGGAVWGPPVLPRGAALREGPRAFGSQRQRKSLKTFFLFSQPARPSSRSSSPSSPQWRRRRGRRRLVSDSGALGCSSAAPSSVPG